MTTNRNKIINDPVYGFITIPNDLIFEIIEHPYFQRLRQIKQLGLTGLIYPGALHTRFHHAIGSMYLMQQALYSLRSKRVEISDQEFEACLIAILLHDIGHGPFSHTLEFNLLNNVTHEKISVLFFERLNQEFNGALDMALQIFTNQYHRKFFHQLVSSQLDIDRLDYLKRDSYFTGVSEGHIGSERIINMLNVKDDEIVVEEKGIYSIENFLSARRLMYWQVYLHKTAVSAEEMLINLIKRAKYLTQQGLHIEATPPLKILLERNIGIKHFKEDPEVLNTFALLDDSDIWGSMKFWRTHEDKVLSGLSTKLIERKIFKIILASEKPLEEWVDTLKDKVQHRFQLSNEELAFYTSAGQISNSAYISSGQKIKILTKKGLALDIVKATDLPNIKAMSKIVTKHFFCWPEMD
ncbi:HD domain-containing protein [Reichenbachiella carrageenanivorans]|uniref:HD domain-containing protein n=1 Tax=Reichenbachiella carrageenanivorans TaxID=2979869 RepID=A0ABY6D080_9BACT|nr:HD domain-containing protein [Reichenbachiella carrageenanivorans]UXX79577.1 HD domain-containing protein [Reichenbachiella carrageenanivorans]